MYTLRCNLGEFQLSEQVDQETLKKVMTEILFILEKYDVAHSIILNKGARTEFSYKYDTDWSIVTTDIETNYNAIRSRSKDYDSKKQQLAHINRTVGMLSSIRDLSTRTALNTELLLSVIQDKFVIEGADLEHLPGLRSLPPTKAD